MELKELEKQDEGKLAEQLAESVDDVTADSYSDIKLRDKSQAPYFMRSMSTSSYMIMTILRTQLLRFFLLFSFWIYIICLFFLHRID